MRILTANEQEAFDKPPLFDHKERKQFFDPPKGLMEIGASLRSPDGQIGFLLMCGYFKATKRFYQPQDFHERDIEAVARVLRLPSADFSPVAYAKQTRARHHLRILDFHGFVPFDESAKSALAVEVATMARMHLKPRLIFDRCLDFLVRMLPPNNLAIRQLSQDEGISEATLHKWRAEARSKGQLLPDADAGPEGWSSRDKFAAVLETAALNETDLA
jgi:hypothetical protein